MPAKSTESSPAYPTTKIELNNEAIRDIANLATSGVTPQLLHVDLGPGPESEVLGSIPVAVVQKGVGVVGIESLVGVIESGRALARKLRLQNTTGPDQRDGTAKHQSLASFVQHLKRFAAEETAVWANVEKRTITSVFDYHHAGRDGSPRWGKHRGEYACPLSEAWFAWGGEKGLVLTQEEFASLLDERDVELASGMLSGEKKAPDPAQLMTLAAHLEVYSNHSARSEIEKETGKRRIAYTKEEGVAAGVAGNAVSIPKAFMITVPIFQDSAPQLIEVRLSATVKDGDANFSVHIHRATQLLRDAFNRICSDVSSTTGVVIFSGVSELG